jgi:hypothetical protein
MKPQHDIVISASRRTDIPAFYMKWFMKEIEKGWFEVKNPFNKKVRFVTATPDHVNTIVFWSKNFNPFIQGEFGTYLKKKGYNLFFNFTINSDSILLEPHVPPLRQRLDQLHQLCQIFGERCINLRFDPICFYSTKKENRLNNLNDFSTIITAASQYGITRCVTSFMDHYPKVAKRASLIDGFVFIDPPVEKKIKILTQMQQALVKKHIELFVCCEKTLLDALPDNSGIHSSSCIDNVLLTTLYGGNLSLKKDYGQRTKNGCGCNVSTDIGSYIDHPCYHNCLFCYANPSDNIQAIKNT